MQAQIPKPEIIKSSEQSNFYELETLVALPKQIVESRRIMAYRTYNNTFLILTASQYFFNCLYHVSADGTIINKRNDAFIELNLISQHEAIYWNRQNSKLLVKQWNLQTNRILTLQIKQQMGNESDFQIFFFPQTNLFSTVQYEKAPSKTKSMLIKLQYYSYPIKSQTAKPKHVYKSDKHEVKSSYRPQKLNNHSGIVWTYYQASFVYMSATCIHVFDLRHQKGKEFQCFKFQHFFNKDKDLDSSVYQIWQPEYGSIYLNCGIAISQRTHNICQNKPQKLQQLKKKARHLHFIWDYRNQKFTNIKIDSEYQVQFVNGLRKIQRFQLVKRQEANQRSTKSTMRERPLYIRKPVCYYNLSSSQILFSESTSSLIYQEKQVLWTQFTYPFNQPQIYHESSYTAITQNNVDYDYLLIKTRKYSPFSMNLHQITVFFMEEIILNNCDEDLLNYVTGMLNNKNLLIQQGWKYYHAYWQEDKGRQGYMDREEYYRQLEGKQGEHVGQLEGKQEEHVGQLEGKQGEVIEEGKEPDNYKQL